MHPQRLLILFYLVLWATLIQMSAQNSDIGVNNPLYFGTLTSEDGLPSQNTYNTYQDRYGFLWISTDEGLTLYNGYSFKSFFNDAAANVFLSGACGFHEDKDGVLWVVGGSGSLHYYKREEERFYAYRLPLEDGWIQPSAHTIIRSGSDMWVSGFGGVRHINLENDSVRTLSIEEVRAPDSWPIAEKVRIGAMHLEGDHTLWLGTRKFGFVKYDLKEDTTHFYRFDPQYDLQLLDDWITDIVTLDDKTLLLADHATGVILWDLETETVKKTIRINELLNIESHVAINDIHHIGDQLYWLATEKNGLILFDLKSNEIIKNYTSNSTGTDTRSLSSDEILHVNQDDSGTLWVGSSTLQQASGALYDFVDYLHEPNDINSIPVDDIYWMSKLSSDKIIASTNKGAFIFDPDDGISTYPLYSSSEPQQAFGVADSKNNHAWIGTYDKLLQIDLASNSIIKSYNRDIKVDDQNNILRRMCRIIEDKNQNLWMSDHWGRLKYINPTEDIVTNVYELAQDSASGKFVNVLSILDDPSNDRVIVGLDLGIALVSYKDRRVKKLSLTYGDLDLSKSSYNYLYRDLQDNIWAIIDGRTYQLDLESEKLDYLNLNEQHDIGSFKWIVEEPMNTYWLSSYKGILRYDKLENKSSIYFTPNVGGSTFNESSPVVQTKGKVYFSGYKGISVLDPKALASDTRSKPAKISNILINQSPLEANMPVYDMESMKLRYNQNDIDITLSNLQFVNQQDCQYRYRLLPNDEEWINNGTDNTLELYNLQPDNYTLEVNAANSDGIWSKQITQLVIEITPPWWKTYWARALMLIIGFGGILMAQRYRYNLRLAKEKEFATLRTKISSDLHDDVGTILTGISMQSELLEDVTSDDTRPIVQNIASQSKEAMTRMRDTVWAIDTRKDTIADLKDRMLDFIGDTLYTKEIIYTFNEDILKPSTHLKPDIRQAAYLIFKESITNIVKHSDAKAVDIRLIIDKSKLSVVIHDNGSKKKELKTSGLGLSNCRQRAERLKGSYQFSYNQGYRTEFELPIR